jgi:hypothetical protein
MRVRTGYIVDRNNDKSLKRLRSKQLKDRAIFFKRLAIGAADAKFASKLQLLVEEYEAAAARVMLEAEPAMLRVKRATAHDAPAYRPD